MALINGIYVFVQDENVDYGLEITSHPVEKGINISDHARRQPYTIKLTGEIVGADAANKRSQIEQLLNGAAVITYQGRNVKTNGIIESFSTGHPNTIKGGCSFEMTIKEIRVAKSGGFIGNTTPTKANTTPVKDVQETGTQKIEKNSMIAEVYNTQVGDRMYSPFTTRVDKQYSTLLKLNENVNPLKVEAGTKITTTKPTTGNLKTDIAMAVNK